MNRNNSGFFALVAALLSIAASVLLLWSARRPERAPAPILVLPAPVVVVTAPPLVKVIAAPPVPPPAVPAIAAPPIMPPRQTPPKKRTPPRQTTPPPAVLPVIVSKTGRDKYRTISDAVSQEPEGTRILVRAGVYHESVFVQKTVEIVRMDGEPAGSVIVDGDGASCFTFQHGDAHVQGIAFRGEANDGNAKGDSAIYISSGKPALTNCDVTGAGKFGIVVTGAQTAPRLQSVQVHDCAGTGIEFADHAQGTLTDCRIVASRMPNVETRDGSAPVLRACVLRDSRAEGLSAQGASKPVLQACDISGNTTMGVQITGQAAPTFQTCDIHASKRWGVHLEAGSRATLTDCDVYDNASTGLISFDSAVTLTHCRLHDNREQGVNLHTRSRGVVTDCDIYQNNGAGLDCWNDTQATLTDCRAYHNGIHGIGIVGSSHATLTRCEAWENKSAGIASTDGGDPTCIACKLHNNGERGFFAYEGGKGTLRDCELYRNGWCEADSRLSSLRLFHCHLHDGQHGLWAIQSGTLDAHDCVIEQYSDTPARSEREGHLALANCRLHDTPRQCVFVADGADATLTDCDLSRSRDVCCVEVIHQARATLTHCHLHDGAGGVSVYDGEPHITLNDCEIDHQRGHGGWISHGGQIVGLRCKFHHNGDEGLNLTDNARATLTDCDIADNTHSGMGVGHSAVALARCKLRGNGWAGIHMMDGASGTIQQCDFDGNAREGLHLMQGVTPDVQGSRFHANRTDGLLLDAGAAGQVHDCDLYGNAGQNLHALAPAQTTLTGNRVEGS